MARPREFDRNDVLDKAMQTFWSKGYEATSMQDLVDATELHRGSLYGAFGSKQQLFLTVIDRYAEVVIKKLLDLLDGSNPGKDSIRSFFLTVIDHVMTGGPLRGCLVTNSAVERGLSDPDTAAKVGICLVRIEERFHKALLRAQAAGELRRGEDLGALARYLTCCLQGLLVTGKVRPERELLEEIVKVTLSVLE